MVWSLKRSYAHDMLTNLYRLWARPVHIETVIDDVKTTLSYDGHEHKATEVK